MKNPKEIFIRADLNQTCSTETYFRLNKELRTFLQELIDKGYDIEAIMLDLNDGALNKVGWNIGFKINKLTEISNIKKSTVV